MREIIDNNNKKIHKLEQEIDELKCQLQDTQRQSDSLCKRLFNFENCKAKDSNAAFYTGFQSWDTLMAVFKYLDPGERVISQLYTGSISDREIIRRSGFFFTDGCIRCGKNTGTCKFMDTC